MNYTIKNEQLEVEISAHGAEIKKILFNNHDYLHDGNKQFWNRTAPILWPNIGAIKNNTTYFNGKPYKLGKHGFLRDQDLELVSINPSEVIFKLTSSDKTLEIYPFNFEIYIDYKLVDSTINSSIKVINKSLNIMPFNLGLHPAFKIPVYEGEAATDYEIEFAEKGSYEMPVVDLKTGLIDFEKRNRSFINLKTLPINYEDYKNDALIFENITTHNVTLFNKNHTHGVNFKFDDFAHLGIWTPYGLTAPFICLEPWIGCGDSPISINDFSLKRDIINLNSGEEKIFSYQITIF